MWSSALIFAQETAPATQQQQPQGSIFGPLLFMVMIFGVMYLFLILPNQRREKQRRQMLESLGKGDEVVTQGGICGTIVGLNEKTIVLKVSDDPVTKLEFVKGAVSQVSSRADDR